MNHLKAYFGEKDIGKIKRRDVEQYVAMRKAVGVKPGTLNRALSYLKNMLPKADDGEYLEVNTAWGVSQQREEAAEVEFLREEEIGQLLNLCPAHIKPVSDCGSPYGLTPRRIVELNGEILTSIQGTKGLLWCGSRRITISVIFR